jgi:peptidyl-prolyl cis-trans isomerase D
MLQVMRDKAQGWISWTLIGAIAIAFTFIGTGSFFNQDKTQQVAKVNGKAISWQRFAERYEQVRAQNASAADMDVSELKSMLLENMVRELALIQASEKRGFTVSSQQINQLIQGIDIFQENGHFSIERLNQLLQQLHLTQYEFHHQIQEMMTIAQIEEGVKDTAFSLSSDLDNHLKYINQKRNVKYAEIDGKQFESEIVITEGDLNAYYTQHANAFMTEEQAQVEYITLPLSELMAKVEVSDADAKEYYETHKNLFETPAKVKVAHILIAAQSSQTQAEIEKAKQSIQAIQKRIEAGESFETLARELSEDPASAHEGGVLDWVSKGEVVPQFEQAAFDLKATGDVSDVIQTAFGFHLIKLLDRKKSEVQTYAEVKTEILSEIKRQKAEEQQINFADDIVSLAYEHPETLQPIADKIDQDIKISDFITRTSAKGVLADPAVVSAIFNEEVLELKQNSDLLKVEPDTYIVLRVKEHKAAKQKPFSQVEDEIKIMVKQEKLNQILKNKADAIVADLHEVKDLDKFATANKLNFIEKTVSRSEVNIDRSLLSKIFSLPRPAETKFAVGSTLIANGYAIVLVDNVIDGQLDDVPADRVSFIRGFLANSLGEIDYDLYVSEIIKQSKIEKLLPAPDQVVQE